MFGANGRRRLNTLESWLKWQQMHDGTVLLRRRSRLGGLVLLSINTSVAETPMCKFVRESSTRWPANALRLGVRKEWKFGPWKKSRSVARKHDFSTLEYKHLTNGEMSLERRESTKYKQPASMTRDSWYQLSQQCWLDTQNESLLSSERLPSALKPILHSKLRPSNDYNGLHSLSRNKLTLLMRSWLATSTSTSRTCSGTGLQKPPPREQHERPNSMKATSPKALAFVQPPEPQHAQRQENASILRSQCLTHLERQAICERPRAPAEQAASDRFQHLEPSRLSLLIQAISLQLRLLSRLLTALSQRV